MCLFDPFLIILRAYTIIHILFVLGFSNQRLSGQLIQFFVLTIYILGLIWFLSDFGLFLVGRLWSCATIIYRPVSTYSSTIFSHRLVFTKSISPFLILCVYRPCWFFFVSNVLLVYQVLIYLLLDIFTASVVLYFISIFFAVRSN